MSNQGLHWTCSPTSMHTRRNLDRSRCIRCNLCHRTRYLPRWMTPSLCYHPLERTWMLSSLVQRLIEVRKLSRCIHRCQKQHRNNSHMRLTSVMDFRWLRYLFQPNLGLDQMMRHLYSNNLSLSNMMAPRLSIDRLKRNVYRHSCTAHPLHCLHLTRWYRSAYNRLPQAKLQKVIQQFKEQWSTNMLWKAHPSKDLSNYSNVLEIIHLSLNIPVLTCPLHHPYHHMGQQ